MTDEQKLDTLLNDPFLKHILEEKENRMSNEEIQKWANRCKTEVKLSKPRFDGDDVTGWTDECEAWLLNTTEVENVKFSSMDIPLFLGMLYNWLNEQYDNLA